MACEESQERVCYFYVFSVLEMFCQEQYKNLFCTVKVLVSLVFIQCPFYLLCVFITIDLKGKCVWGKNHDCDDFSGATVSHMGASS